MTKPIKKNASGGDINGIIMEYLNNLKYVLWR
jgi:hypothetical protein